MAVVKERRSIDLSAYPDLVVVMLGFKVRRLVGFRTLFGLGKGLRAIKTAPPDGLLADENFLFGLTHIGIRQYWRDLDSLERFTRSAPHSDWWRDIKRYGRGAGFWHESYRMAGGMEAIYIDMPGPIGFGRFAPDKRPVGPFMTARERLRA